MVESTTVVAVVSLLYSSLVETVAAGNACVPTSDESAHDTTQRQLWKPAKLSVRYRSGSGSGRGRRAGLCRQRQPFGSRQLCYSYTTVTTIHSDTHLYNYTTMPTTVYNNYNYTTLPQYTFVICTTIHLYDYTTITPVQLYNLAPIHLCNYTTI